MDTSTQTPNNQVLSGTGGAAKGKKSMWVFTVVLVAVAIVVAAVVIAARQSQTSAEKVGAVTITRSGFTPSTIKVKKGESVMWITRGNEAHQVVAAADVASNNAVAFDSEETLGPNDSYTFTFDKAGTYNYYDKLNPYALKGTVIVE
ncbi:MAG TPA: cupredoxin domain-containing protein [Nevskiaceae bacterium]|nr:cupredoxin domain-containing protein [Nevskiaceae bacterium]